MAQNLHFWSIWARPCRLIQCPVGGSVGGCGARAVSRKTPIYFILISDDFKNITFLRRQQCQLSLIQIQTCATFCHCDCEEWVACFLEFFSAGYGSHSGALCHQTSHSEVKVAHKFFRNNKLKCIKVDRVFCLIHTLYFIDEFCIHSQKNVC